MCWPEYWCLDRVHGEHPGYLIRLYCERGHIHCAELAETYAAARQRMEAWRDEAIGEILPGAGWTIEDRARHLLILPDGRQWPLQEERG